MPLRIWREKLEKDGWEYELTFQYEHDEDLENQIEDLAAEMSSEADSRNGFIECHFSEVGVVDDNSSSLDEKKSLTQDREIISVSSHLQPCCDERKPQWINRLIAL